MHTIDFVVARNDLQQSKTIETQLPDAAALPDDALLVKVTRFAFTANNITYAAFAVGVVQIPFLINLAISWWRGAPAGDNPWDATTLIASALLLAAVAVAASWIPARRAAGLDPLAALRHE